MQYPAEQFLSSMNPVVYHRPTGFMENWQASMGQFIDEHLSISRWLNEGPLRESKKAVFDLHAAGRISDDVFNSAASMTGEGVTLMWDRIIESVNQNLNLDLQTHTEIREGIREELKLRRDYAESVFAGATGWGKFGQFAGNFHAAALDPILLPSYFVGPIMAAKGASLIARMGKGALYTGAIEGGLEAAIQPFVYSWKNEIGAKYTSGDAIKSVMTVVGFAGTVGGLSQGIAAFFNRNRRLIDANPELKEAAQQVRNTQTELKKALDSDMPPAEFNNRVEQSVRELETPTVRTKVKAEGEEAVDLGTEGVEGTEVNEKMKVFDEQMEGESVPVDVIDEYGVPSSVSVNYKDRIMDLSTEENRLNELSNCLV